MTDTTTPPLLTRTGTRHELVSRTPVVTSVQQLTPVIRRVVLGGEELDGWASPGPTDHVRLRLGTTTRRDLTPLPLPPGPDGHPRLALDVVLHDGPAPLSEWARTVRVGDTVGIAGPRGSRHVPEGMDRLVLVVDDTALPSTSRWLAAVQDVPVDVVAHLGETSTQAYLSPGLLPHASFTWSDGGAGPEAWLGAVQGLSALGERTFVYAAGEATALVPIRRHLRDVRGLRRDQLEVSGYWRRGVADFDHHAPLTPDEADGD